MLTTDHTDAKTSIMHIAHEKTCVVANRFWPIDSTNVLNNVHTDLYSVQCSMFGYKLHH